MNRRLFVSSVSAVSALLWSQRSFAHHGWSSFDEAHPIYLTGKVKSLTWQNPHVELVITVPADASIPMSLPHRRVPPQAIPVNGTKILASAKLPKKRGDWTLELSPMTRIEAWKVAKPNIGDGVEAVGYTFKNEAGASIMRVEYYIIGDNMYGLRSMPA